MYNRSRGPQRCHVNLTTITIAFPDFSLLLAKGHTCEFTREGEAHFHLLRAQRVWRSVLFMICLLFHFFIPTLTL